eukprot:TRINITY_DN13347_c0_g1_i1.p1 TRINITY_DN13347_c0_g1~~TRINITY_DN13347_c0_g1_i1.p1  ORF type:complete len:910 (+),score=182.60 TRINITY_DN13347_c0_g1_i1:63-2792(+)
MHRNDELKKWCKKLPAGRRIYLPSSKLKGKRDCAKRKLRAEAMEHAATTPEGPVPYTTEDPSLMSLSSFVKYQDKNRTHYPKTPENLCSQYWSARPSKVSNDERTEITVKRRLEYLEELWEFLDVPQENQSDFMRSFRAYHSKGTAGSESHYYQSRLLDSEISVLAGHKTKTAISLRAIKLREQLITDLRDFSDAFSKHRRFYRASVVKRELEKHLTRIGEATEAVVNALSDWQSEMGSRPQVFHYQGTNYLQAMRTDLAFLETSPLRSFLTIDPRDNPLLLTTDPPPYTPQVASRLYETQLFYSRLASPLPSSEISSDEYYRNCTAFQVKVKTSNKDNDECFQTAWGTCRKDKADSITQLDKLLVLDSEVEAGSKERLRYPSILLSTRKQRTWRVLRSIFIVWKAHRILKRRVMERKAATRIQQFYKRSLAARMLLQLRRERGASIVIQKWIRGVLVRIKFVASYERFSAARCIQCNWRRVMAIRLVRRLAREMRATIIMQRFWRKTLVIIKLRILLVRHRAMQLIQRNTRRFLAVKEVAWRKRVLASTLLIQRNFKCLIARQELRRLKVQHKASMQIQKHWRGCLGRKEAVIRLLNYIAACSIQQTWRCHHAKHVLVRKRKERKASIIIQLAWRMYSSKKRAARLSAEQCAALRNFVQRSRDIETHRAALLIQIYWRRGRYRDAILEMIKRKKADMAAFLASQREERARFLQPFLRKFISRVRMERFRRIQTATHKIQCVFRTVLARLHVRKTRAAHMIQRCWAEYCRRVIAKAVIAGQRGVWRKKMLFKEKVEIVVRIQAVWRGHMCRMWVHDVMAERCKNRDILVAHQEVVGACVAIQSAFRGHLCKRLFFRLKTARDDLVASKIQALWRGLEDRRYTATLRKACFKRDTAAALKIQALWRCYAE